MDAHKENAVILANAMFYASPSYDDKGARQKQRSWEKFIKSLDWRKISGTDKKKPVSSFISDLSSLKVGVKK